MYTAMEKPDSVARPYSEAQSVEVVLESRFEARIIVKGRIAEAGD